MRPPLRLLFIYLFLFSCLVFFCSLSHRGFNGQPRQNLSHANQYFYESLLFCFEYCCLKCNLHCLLFPENPRQRTAS